MPQLRLKKDCFSCAILLIIFYVWGSIFFYFGPAVRGGECKMDNIDSSAIQSAMLRRMLLLLLWMSLSAFILAFPDSRMSIVYCVATFLYVGEFVVEKSSVHMMYYLGFSTFIFLPAMLNWYYLGFGLELFVLTSLVSIYFLESTKHTVAKSFVDYGTSLRVLFCCLSLIIVALVLFRFGSMVAAVFPLYLIVFSLSLRDDFFLRNFIIFICFVVTYLLYLVLSWNGFGRVVVVGWFFLATLYYAWSIGFLINKYIFSVIPGLGAAFFTSREILNLKFNGFESALTDSAYAPYRLASTFIDHFDRRGIDFSGYFDQVIFTLLVFVPRDIWPEKPYGFGFEYTTMFYSQGMIDSGHSIASTLIGDHIFYLGYFGVCVALIVLTAIAFAINHLYKLRLLNGNAVILASASMMVFVWGGMTSLSARIALPAIVFICFYVIFRIIFTESGDESYE